MAYQQVYLASGKEADALARKLAKDGAGAIVRSLIAADALQEPFGHVLPGRDAGPGDTAHACRYRGCGYLVTHNPTLEYLCVDQEVS